MSLSVRVVGVGRMVVLRMSHSQLLAEEMIVPL